MHPRLSARPSASHETPTKPHETLMKHSDRPESNPPHGARPRLRVGDCVVDLERAVLLDAERRPRHLRARAWRVLAHLAARPGHLVDREALMTAVWTDVIVTDDSLVQAVADIRRALGEPGRHALRTVPRRGYMLLAEAEAEAEHEPEHEIACPAPCSADTPDRSLARELDARAQRTFVGREAELERLVAMTCDPSSPIAVALVHGPGGIGKSTLLERVKHLTAERGVPVIGIDARLVEPTPPALLEALARAAGSAHVPDSIEALAATWPGPQTLLVIDSAEHIGSLQPLLRDRLLPALPAGTRAVIASRDPPDVRWHAHPLWGLSVETLRIGELARQDSLALLERLGVAAPLRAGAVDLARGHPLALALLAAQLRRSEVLPEDLGPDLLRMLVQRCVVQVPDAAHWRALQVAALVNRVTEALLARTVPDGPAPALYDWLARQDYVRRHADGLSMHELVSEAVSSDLCSRDPLNDRALRNAVFAHLTTVLREKPSRELTTLGSLLRLLRDVASFRRSFDLERIGRYTVDTAEPGDREAILALRTSGLPAFERGAFDHWLGHPATRWQVIREDGVRVCGVSCFLRLDRVCDDDLRADPLVRRVLDALSGAIRGTSVMARFTIPEGERGPRNPAMGALQCNQARSWAGEPGLHHWVIASVHPDRHEALLRDSGFERMPDCDVVADGATIGCFVHDWREEPWERWYERVTAQGRSAP
jgi:DNA-binding winged helix-turn-helix (wHTH) protein